MRLVFGLMRAAPRVVLAPGFIWLEEPSLRPAQPAEQAPLASGSEGSQAASPEDASTSTSTSTSISSSPSASATPTPTPTPPVQGASGAEAFRLGVERYLPVRPELVTYISEERARRALMRQRLYQDRLELAEQLAVQGIEQYKELNQLAASRNLERALEHYQAIRYELIAPRRVAQVLLYLALSYIEQDARLPQALRAMRQMIALDPGLVLARGYYADKVVELYEDARRALVADLAQRGPRLEQLEQARDLAQRAGADIVLYGFIVPAQEPGQVTLTLHPYLAQEARFEAPEVMIVEALDDDALREAADRLASRWASCLVWPDPQGVGPAASTGRGALSVSLGMSYASFLRNPRPLEDLFGNFGIGLGARWLITREFGVIGRAQLLLAQRDRSGRLVDEYFPTFRGFFGGELGVELVDRLSISIQLAGDVTHVSDFEVWGDANCIPQESCAEPPVAFNDFGLMLGVNARPALSVRLSDALHATAAASFSYFFYTGQGQGLNFPLGAELNVQYRF